MITSKKQKFVGIQQWPDPQTGEMVPMQVAKVVEKDFNFHKVWLEHLILSFEEITNKKLQLAFWIIKNLNAQNLLIATQQKICEETGLSNFTVHKTLKALMSGKIPFLKKVNSGVYQVNPDVLFKGEHGKRMGIIYDYNQEQKKDNTTNPNHITLAL